MAKKPMTPAAKKAEKAMAMRAKEGWSADKKMEDRAMPAFMKAKGKKK